MADIRRLPGATAEHWEWQLSGACRDEDSTLFFHPEGERGRRREERDLAAKAVCARCPVILECREHALRTREPYGVWGGLSEADRELILTGAAAGPESGSGRADDLEPAPA